MQDRKKTKQQLIEELAEARRRIHAFESIESLRMKETEAALLESERRFRILTETTSDWLWEVDAAGAYTYASPKVRDLLGYDPEELIGKTPFDLMPPEEASRVRAEFLEYAALKSPFARLENVSLHKTGRPVVIETSAVPILSSSGNLEGYRGIDRDVTERKQAEEALKQSENRARNIVESSPMGIHMYKLESNRLVFTGANPAADRLLGLDHSRFVGRALEEAFPAARDTEIPRRYRRAAESGESWRSEQINYEDDNVKGAFEVYAFQTSPGNMAVFFLDITNRVRVQEALRESEEQYRHLLENINDVIFTLNEHRVITYISPTIETMTGLVPAEIIGRRFTDFVEVEDLPEDPDTLFERRASGDTTPIEYRVRLKSGQTRWVKASSKPLRTGDELTGFQGVLVDITDTKKAEEEKEALEAQLRQAQKMEAIGQLAGGIAHDFNNLLSPILGYAELLLLDLHPEDPRYGNVLEIHKAGDRAKDLTRQLLAFGRKQMIEQRPIDLSEVISGFEKMLRRTIRENIEIHLRLSESLGWVEGDISQIEQILMNLVVNAQDAMPGGGAMTIETTDVFLDEDVVIRHPDFHTGPCVKLAVRDTGVGIEEENLDRIFEPFFTTKEKGKGTGLGLATVYGIVKQHGGGIIAESKLGHGTTFEIYLPKAEESAEPVHEMSADRGRASGTETIVVVEDDEMVRNLAAVILKEYGYDVRCMESAEECIRVTDNLERVDLLLTDIVMPHMNGSELYRRLVALRPELKVLFMSGYLDDTVALHGVTDERGNFIQKPFTVQSLTKKVRELLDK
jgi:PAS domain S-box-containing protein